MVAEWLWIQCGRNDVSTIAQYNPNIAAFSDDGVVFAGAYGAPIAEQWARVRDTLRNDHNTRQAVFQIYRPPTGPTKDVPCTIALQFLIRDEKLNVIATMRSSDVWLGLPYDFFNFTMLANAMSAEVGVELGEAVMQLGSSHLYASDEERAKETISWKGDGPVTITSPQFIESVPSQMEDALMTPSILQLGLKTPWAQYANVLRSVNQTSALTQLMELNDAAQR